MLISIYQHDSRVDESNAESTPVTSSNFSPIRSIESVDERVEQAMEALQQMKTVKSFDKIARMVATEMERINTFRDTYRAVNARLDIDLKDDYAMFWLPIMRLEDSFPVRTTGDGSCFFNAAARQVYGDERLAPELRIRVLSEGIINMDRHLDHNYLVNGFVTFVPTTNAQSVPEIYSMTSPSSQQVSKRFQGHEFVYKKEIVRLAAPFTPAHAWQPHQLAEVLHRPVNMYHPDMPNITGTFGQLRDCMNRTILPEDADFQKRAPITIAWTRILPSRTDPLPNHFVSVVP